MAKVTINTNSEESSFLYKNINHVKQHQSPIFIPFKRSSSIIPGTNLDFNSDAKKYSRSNKSKRSSLEI